MTDFLTQDHRAYISPRCLPEMDNLKSKNLETDFEQDGLSFCCRPSRYELTSPFFL